MNKKRPEYKIQWTKSYAMFIIPPEQRVPNTPQAKAKFDKRVMRIKAEMAESPFFFVISPILVNEKCEAVDGDARIEAAKQLNIEIGYVVVPGLTVNDAIAKANYEGDKWRKEERMESFTKQEKMDYVVATEFVTKYPELNLDKSAKGALILLTDNTWNCMGKFQNGNLKVTNYANACEVMDKIRRVGQVYNDEKIYRYHFIYAFYLICKHPTFNFEHFLVRLKTNKDIKGARPKDMLKDCSRMETYLNALGDINNHGVNSKSPNYIPIHEIMALRYAEEERLKEEARTKTESVPQTEGNYA